MEVQSKQDGMAGWAVRKDGGALFINQCLYLATMKATTQPEIDVTKSTCILLEKDAI